MPYLSNHQIAVEYSRMIAAVTDEQIMLEKLWLHAFENVRPGSTNTHKAIFVRSEMSSLLRLAVIGEVTMGGGYTRADLRKASGSLMNEKTYNSRIADAISLGLLETTPSNGNSPLVKPTDKLLQLLDVYRSGSKDIKELTEARIALDEARQNQLKGAIPPNVYDESCWNEHLSRMEGHTT